MQVREFESGDKESFSNLCEMFYESQSTLRGFNKDIAEKTFLRVIDRHENLWGYLFIDKDEEVPIGYALVTSYWSNEEGGNVIVVDELYLNPLNRHKGYARLFMGWLEEHFSDAEMITLEVHAKNERAREFYERAGFKPDGYISYTKRLNKN